MLPTNEERNWAMAAHAGQVVAVFATAGTLAVLVPLVIWLLKREESAFVADHALEALNFQITLWILLLVYAAVSGVLVCIGVGILMLLVIPVLYLVPVLVFGILGALAASRGDTYRYPYILRLVS